MSRPASPQPPADGESAARLEFDATSAASQALLTTAFYPLTLGRTLIQMGYEPIKPVPVRTIFGTPKLAYPNIVKYLNYVRLEDGWLGLYRGLGYRLLFATAERGLFVFVFNRLDEHVATVGLSKRGPHERPRQDGADEPLEQQLRRAFDHCMCQVLAKSLSLALTYPLQVMMVRSVAEFVGRERIYNCLPTSLGRLLQETGFYAGFAPRLLSEVYNVLLFSSLQLVVKRLVASPELTEYVTRSLNVLIGSFLYPYELCSTVMAVNSCSSLLASRIEPPFPRWTACYASLANRGQLKRGSTLIWRYIAIAHAPR